VGSPKFKKKKLVLVAPGGGVHVEFIWLRKHIVSINPLKILNKVAPSKPSHKHNYYNWNSTFKLSSSYIQNFKKQFKIFLMLWMFPLYHRVTICYAHKTDQLLIIIGVFFLWQIFLPCQSVFENGNFFGKKNYVFEVFFMSLFNSFYIKNTRFWFI